VAVIAAWVAVAVPVLGGVPLPVAGTTATRTEAAVADGPFAGTVTALTDGTLVLAGGDDSRLALRLTDGTTIGRLRPARTADLIPGRQATVAIVDAPTTWPRAGSVAIGAPDAAPRGAISGMIVRYQGQFLRLLSEGSERVVEVLPGTPLSEMAVVSAGRLQVGDRVEVAGVVVETVALAANDRR
jgi:hypothetical protein